MYQEVKKYTQIIKNTSNNAQKEANFQGGYVILFDAKNSMYFSSVVPIVRLNWIKISLYKNPNFFIAHLLFFRYKKRNQRRPSTPLVAIFSLLSFWCLLCKLLLIELLLLALAN